MIDFNDIQSQNSLRLRIQPLTLGCTSSQAAILLNIKSNEPIRLLPGHSPTSIETFILSYQNELFNVRVVDDCDLTKLNKLLSNKFVQFSKIVNRSVSVSQAKAKPNRSEEALFNAFEDPQASPEAKLDWDEDLNEDKDEAEDAAELTEQDDLDGFDGAKLEPESQLTKQQRKALEYLQLELELNFFLRGITTTFWNILPNELDEAASDNHKKLNKFKQVLDNCQLQAYGEKYCFYLPSRDLSQQSSAKQERAVNKKVQTMLAQGENYLLLGTTGSIAVKFQQKQSHEQLCYRSVGRIYSNYTLQQRQYSSNVFVGKLSLKSDPDLQDIDQVALTLKEQSDSGAYFNVWRHYDAFEIFNQVQKTQSRGLASYHTFSLANDGSCEFVLDPSSHLSVNVGDIVEISSKRPEYSGFSSIEQILSKITALSSLGQSLMDIQSTTGEVTEVSKWNNSIRVKLAKKQEVPLIGFISISLRGFLVQFKRRMNALDRIMSNQSNIVNLGDLFNLQNPEALRRVAFTGKLKHYDALTPRVRSKIFSHDPTENQLSAIKIALNTPDIALIQGPPGTGKTTIILAIIERLNEIMRKEREHDNLQAQILVSSYQHEAVDNVISKLHLNSLPTFKFGSSRSDTNLRIDRACEQWRSSISEQIHQTYGDKLQLNRNTVQVQHAIAQYECLPTQEHAKKLVQEIAQLPAYVFNDELSAALQAEIQRLSAHALGQDEWHLEKARRSVYALRTDPVSYADDGWLNLRLAWENLKEVIDNPQLLKRLHKLTCGLDKYPQPEMFFAELEAVQQKLLEYLQPELSQSIPQKHPATMELIRLVSARIEATAANYEISQSDPQDRRLLKIVADLVNTLDNNFEEVQNTLRSLNIVVAATVQQSMHSDLINLSSNAGNTSGDYQYDTVIIDEAARATPIDLLIPMVLASRRIILVGDHKQLPHIVDDVIEKQLGNYVDANPKLFDESDWSNKSDEELEKLLMQDDWLEDTPSEPEPETQSEQDQQQSAATVGNKASGLQSQFNSESHAETDSPLHNVMLNELTKISPEQMLNLSMFEFLFSCLQKLELEDHIPRTMTLTNQFRMHPKLGSLISREFYDNQLESPLDASYFDHNLKDAEHCFALWYHLPFKSGGEERKGTSRIRKYEAQCIIWRLRKWLRDPSSQGMSFGVVCFYREQVNLIKELALKNNIFIQDGDKVRLSEEFDDPTVLDRLRIDTVDAFQGKEFDVVLLSMVRSSDPEQLNKSLSRLNRCFELFGPGHEFAKQQENAAAAKANPASKTNAASKVNVAANSNGASSLVNTANEAEFNAKRSRAFWSMPFSAKVQHRFFGHLMSTNRLCVALSRQRKLLCVFGDMDMISHPIGRHAIPALAHFSKLCLKEGKVITLVRKGE